MRWNDDAGAQVWDHHNSARGSLPVERLFTPPGFELRSIVFMTSIM
jgi:hypothetical protein